MDICLINNAKPYTGVGKYAYELNKNINMISPHEIPQIFLDYQNREIREINSGHILYKSKKNLLDNKYFWYIRKQKYIPDYEMYHIQNQNLSFLKLNNKIISVFDIFHITDPRNFFYKQFGKFVYSGIREAEHLIASSKYTKDQLVKHYSIDPDKISVIHLGVAEHFFDSGSNLHQIISKYQLPDERKFLIHVSNEQKHKNFDRILFALARLKKKEKFKDVVLLKVGAAQYTSDRKRHLKIIKRAKIESDVIFLDFVPETDLPQLYRLSKALVFPSSREGFGFPPLEAMASGIPVVASEAPAIKEVVGDNALFINPNDIEALSDAMKKIIEDDDLTKSLSIGGIKRAKEFSWEKTAKKTIKIYEELSKN